MPELHCFGCGEKFRLHQLYESEYRDAWSHFPGDSGYECGPVMLMPRIARTEVTHRGEVIVVPVRRAVCFHFHVP